MNRILPFPPLRMMPPMLKAMPAMAWAQLRKDYVTAMRLGNQIISSSELKTLGFQGYTPGQHDVFVCSYSKSGTYWMLQIVSQIAGLGEANFEHIHHIAPWPEVPFPGLTRLQTPTWESAPTELRAIKTHAEADFVPYHPDAKYLFVFRDPKDVLISAFYFSESIMPGLKSIGLDKWTEAFIAGETPFGSWPEHIASFWPWRDRENVLQTTYEWMKADLEKAVRSVSQLMAVDLTDEQVAKVVHRSSFTYMKEHKDKFKPPSPPGTSGTIELIRKGNTGDAAKELTAVQQKAVNHAMKEQLKALGSDFPFDTFYGD
ncbi:MAG: sulfotransferase domain-containing protein [Chloroflexota bacterium]